MNFSCKILYFILMNFCCKIWCLLDGFISHWALCYVGWNVKIVSLFTHVLSVRKNSIPYLNSSRCPRIPNWGVDNTPPDGQLFLKLEVFRDMNPLKSKTSVGGQFSLCKQEPNLTNLGCFSLYKMQNFFLKPSFLRQMFLIPVDLVSIRSP